MSPEQEDGGVVGVGVGRRVGEGDSSDGGNGLGWPVEAPRAACQAEWPGAPLGVWQVGLAGAHCRVLQRLGLEVGLSVLSPL